MSVFRQLFVMLVILFAGLLFVLFVFRQACVMLVIVFAGLLLIVLYLFSDGSA